jgi:hypothetical protein
MLVSINGYRTLTSKPGHHQTAIQTLPTTLGVDSQVVVRLDKLREQRNLTEYTGDTVPESAVAVTRGNRERDGARSLAPKWFEMQMSAREILRDAIPERSWRCRDQHRRLRCYYDVMSYCAV